MPRFRYSLQTLFIVVTAICLWLGWQVYTVRQRSEAIGWMKQKTHMIEFDTVPATTTLGWMYGCAMVFEDAQLPWYRKLMGDRYLKFVGPLHNFEAEERIRVRNTFPEAEVQDN